MEGVVYFASFILDKLICSSFLGKDALKMYPFLSFYQLSIDLLNVVLLLYVDLLNVVYLNALHYQVNMTLHFLKASATLY